MNVFEQLVTKNPMMGEFKRSFRLSLTGTGSGLTSKASMYLLLAVLAFVLINSIAYGEYMDVRVISYFEMGVTCLIAPVLVHGVISGEREKRSLDTLLVCPLTTPQIVVGKLFRSAWAFLIIFGFGLLLQLTTLVMHFVKKTELDGGLVSALQFMGVGTLLGLVVAFMMSSLTLYVSSISKGIGASLTTAIGGAFVLLVIAPGLAQMIFGSTSVVPVSLVSPFGNMWMLLSGNNRGETSQGWETAKALAPFSPVAYMAIGFAALHLSVLRLDLERVGGTLRRNVRNA